MIEKQEVRSLLVRVEKARHSILQPCFAQIGLTFGQGHAKILDTLLKEDHISQKELSTRCHVDATTMSRSLDKLEQSGFLIRKRDPQSRRTFLVCLTEAGAEEARLVHRILGQLDAQIWKGFEMEEMEQLYGYLDRILENLMGIDPGEMTKEKRGPVQKDGEPN